MAVCLCDLYDGVSGEPYGADPRGALRRVLAAYAELGHTVVLAPGARVLPLRARRGLADRLAPLRGQGLAALHRRPPRRPAGHPRNDDGGGRGTRARRRSRAPTSTGAASTRSTSATARRSPRPTGRFATRSSSRSWPRARACSRPSWASRSTATRAPGCTSTSRSRRGRRERVRRPAGRGRPLDARPPLHGRGPRARAAR